ncbi:hypothetical protein FBY35_3041 [Streptomyces sp. SLBN-118]|uniref:imidazolonepropionase-like domain-containing protein n=1 Tax=Streptomyces sp. SLBN-118 TaxID=2768454 RepID=UPI00114F4A2E|nr:hypothetical protein [Streptomyces sp. SLBN-118]TQK52598.1 hypothetical protein FBY35_3041 [Streptomyces sp. SLBN-118]
MLTLHRAAEGHSLVVEGAWIAAIGPYEELLAAYGERARVREWDGVIGPGRHEQDAVALLEHAYWPDPREADELGTGPLTGDALAALTMTDTRWGASARRGVQRLLASGTTTLAGSLTRPSVRLAVERSGLRYAEGPRPLAPGGPASFAVFADDGTCLVTALDGRLVHRRR